MDIREFDLLYNKKSPLYDDDALRNMVHRLLVEEKVITSSADYQVSPQSNKTSPCIQTSTQKRKAIIVREKDENKASKVKCRSNGNQHKPLVNEGCIAALDSMVETFDYNTVTCDGSTVTMDYNTLDDTTENVYSSTETLDGVIKTCVSNTKEDLLRDKDRDISENKAEVAMLRRDVLNTDSTTITNTLYAQCDTASVCSAPTTNVGASSHNTTTHLSNRMELGIRHHLTQNGIKQSIIEPDNTNGLFRKHPQPLVTSTMNSFRSNLLLRKSSTSDHNGKWCDKERTNRHLHKDSSCDDSKQSQKETLCCAPVCSNSTGCPKFNDQMKTSMDSFYDIGPQFGAMYSFPHNANTGTHNSKSEYAYTSESNPGTTITAESNPGTAITVESNPGTAITVESNPGTALTVESKLGSLHSVESKPGTTYTVESKPGTTYTVESKPGTTYTVESKPETALNSESIPVTALTTESKPWSLHPAESKSGSTHTDEDEINSIIDVLVKANTVFKEFPKKGECDRQLLIQKQSRYLEVSKHMSDDPLTIAKYNEETRRRLLESTVEYKEMRITESVKFAKQIPGFVQLPLDDQVNLIKESRTESGLCGGMRGINSSIQVFSSHKGFFFTVEDMKLVFSEQLIYQTLVLSKKISALALSAAEEALLRAITITATGPAQTLLTDHDNLTNGRYSFFLALYRCHLLCYSQAEKIQHKLMACLEHVISDGGKRPAGPRLGNIVDLLVSFRYATEVDIKELKDILLEWPSLPKYELVAEYV